MTPEQIRQVIAEVERRWRERTPAMTVEDALPGYRVGRGEIRTYMHQQGIGIGLGFDEALETALADLFQRLKVEFPNEQWR